MNADQIRAAIVGNPTLLALAQQLNPDTFSIATALSVGRVRVQQPHMVSARGIAGRYGGGPVASEVVLLKLEGARDAMLASADAGRRVFGSLLRRQLGFLNADGLDFGDPVLREQLDQLAEMNVITADEAAHLKALAEVPDVVGEMEVRRAIFADDGQRLV